MTATVTALKTRKPTGLVSFPLLLVEGEEKTGKTYAALALSASPKVGRTFVLELDEPTADEYAPLGPFEILEHKGTHASMFAQLTAATQVPPVAGRPNLIVVDTGSAWWSLLKDWIDHRARGSQKNKAILGEDPDAEIDISMGLWNDAKDRWNAMVYLLRAWPGIGIIVCRGREVAKVRGGKPVAGQTEYSVEAEKTTPNTVSAVVRMTRPHVATLRSVRSLHVDVPAGGIVLDAAAPLEHLVFGILGAGGDFQQSSAILGSIADDEVPDLVDMAIAMFKAGDVAALRNLHATAKAKRLTDAKIMHPDKPEPTTLGAYIAECGKALTTPPPACDPDPAEAVADAALEIAS